MKPPCILSWLAMAAISTAATVTAPRCEYRKNPVGVEVSQPRLSWIIESKDRGVSQSAWQVLAATDAALLEEGKADLWDSGKVASAETIQIAYQGKSPGAGKVCHWKVRVWDHKGEPSAWSDAAEWTVGLDKPSDWKAKWIYQKKEAAASAPGWQEGLAWVWLSGSKPGDQAPGAAFFRKDLMVPEGKAISSARFLMAARSWFRSMKHG